MEQRENDPDLKKRLNYIKYNPLFVGFILILLSLIVTIPNFPMIFIDEPWFGEVSYNLALNGLTSNTSFPYSQNYESYYGNPFVILGSIFIRLFGFNIFSLRLVSYFFFVGACIFLYLLLRRSFNRTIALSIAVLFSMHPFLINTSRLFRPEMIIIFFIILGIFLFFTFKDNGICFIHSALLGLIFSLPFTCHIPGLFSIIIGLVIYIQYKKEIPDFYRQLLCFTAGTLPILLIMFLNFSQNLSSYIELGEKQGTFLLSASKIPAYIMYLLSGFGFWPINIYSALFLLILVISIVSYKKMLPEQKSIWNSLFISLLVITVFLFFLSHYTRLYLVYYFVFSLPLIIAPLYYADRKGIFLIATTIVLLIIFGYQDAKWVNYTKNADYSTFSKIIKESIPPNSNVLGTINYRLSFDSNYHYFAVEDLIKFMKNGGSFNKYIEQNKIDYIIYNYAWDEQSKANNLDLGTPFKDTDNFLRNHTKLVETVNDYYYSNRFGPPNSNQVIMPYCDTLNQISFVNSNRILYWTKIYHIE